MDELRLSFEWIDPLEAKVPELRATWASLGVEVNGEPVTRLYDTYLKSVRDRLFLPLYPMAEWVAQHWWHLLYETETHSRSSAPGYAHRHSLRYAREGYALPDVTFRPLGDTIELAWHATRLPAHRLDFIGHGKVILAMEAVRDTFARFIQAVVERLHQYDLYDTPLEQEWVAIQRADAEEAPFCTAAARLGLDPYDVSDAEADAITEAASTVPASLQEAFFQAADPAHLTEQLTQLKQLLGEQLDVRTTRLAELRQRFEPREQPWQEGYAYARDLRKWLDIRNKHLDSFPVLADALGLKDTEMDQIIRPTDSARLFDVLVLINTSGSPCFAIDERREAARRFAFCRGLFEFLTSKNGGPLMVTRTRSEQQQRNRAFAAEFLAPAEMIQARLSKFIRMEGIEPGEVEEIAQEFGVSPMIIGHQILNHRLALPGYSWYPYEDRFY